MGCSRTNPQRDDPGNACATCAELDHSPFKTQIYAITQQPLPNKRIPRLTVGISLDPTELRTLVGATFIYQLRTRDFGTFCQAVDLGSAEGNRGCFYWFERAWSYIIYVQFDRAGQGEVISCKPYNA